jgi:hypothetical protein
MLHEDFKDLSSFIDRHNRYSTWDAKMRSVLRDDDPSVAAIRARLWGSPIERKRWLKQLWVRLPFRPLLRFLYMYVLRLGFLDGRAGFLYSAFKAVQEFHINAKMVEERLRRTGQLRNPAELDWPPRENTAARSSVLSENASHRVS